MLTDNRRKPATKQNELKNYSRYVNATKIELKLKGEQRWECEGERRQWKEATAENWENFKEIKIGFESTLEMETNTSKHPRTNVPQVGSENAKRNRRKFSRVIRCRWLSRFAFVTAIRDPFGWKCWCNDCKLLCDEWLKGDVYQVWQFLLNKPNCERESIKSDKNSVDETFL